MTDDDLNKLKPCPFCGKEPQRTRTMPYMWACQNPDCPQGDWFTPDAWNTRPIENKLADDLQLANEANKVFEATIAALREAVEAAERERDWAISRANKFHDLFWERDPGTGKPWAEEYREVVSERDAARKELAELRDWKNSALKVMPDFQAIGKLLNVKLGESVSEKIVPAIRELAELKAKLPKTAITVKGK